MKSIAFFLSIFHVTVICGSWNIRLSAAASDWEIQHNDIPKNWRNKAWICSSDVDCTTPDSVCVENRCQCQPNYVFNAEMTSCLKAATHYGDNCEETAQCTAYLLAGGNCEDGVCSCVKGYHYHHGRCMKSSGLNEKCHSDDECYVNGDYDALSCTENVCQCTDGFYKREYRTCRREAKEIGADCLINLDCTFDENAQCNKKTGCFVESKVNESDALRSIINESFTIPKIRVARSDVVVGTKCTSDKECEALGTAACDAAGKCICKPGYFPNDKLTTCIPEIDEKCEPNAESHIKFAECRNGKWGCDHTHVPSRDNRVCRKVATRLATESCVHSEQCYVFGPDAICLNKRCHCNENSHYSEEHMFCWINRRVGENCLIDEDCYVKDFGSKLSCKDSVCACPAGSHLNAAETACINDIANLGDPCTSDTDCSPLKNALCQNDTCTCAENYFDLSGECVAGINAACTVDDDCKIQNSTCHKELEQCRCTSGYTSPSADLCVPVSSFGGECQYDVQCSATALGAICVFPEEPEENELQISRSSSITGTCVCEKGYHHQYERCYQTKVLHEPCKFVGECYVDSSPDSVMCLKGLCTCEWDAVEVNSTYCKTSASTKTVLSSFIGFTIVVVQFIRRLL